MKIGVPPSKRSGRDVNAGNPAARHGATKPQGWPIWAADRFLDGVAQLLGLNSLRALLLPLMCAALCNPFQGIACGFFERLAIRPSRVVVAP